MSEDIKNLKDLEKEAGVLGEDYDKPDSGSSECRSGGNMAWIPGLVLIGIGSLFLLRNFTDFDLNNWWAIFILMPAFGSLGNFIRIYRNEGRINSEARGSLIGGLIMTFIAAIFLFGWDWGVVWPIFLIIGGVGALLSGIFD